MPENEASSRSRVTLYSHAELYVQAADAPGQVAEGRFKPGVDELRAALGVGKEERLECWLLIDRSGSVLFDRDELQQVALAWHFGVSRHRCGQGESAIVVLSRIFVPGTGFCKSRTSRPSCRGGCLDAQVALRGDVHCQPAELGRCSQGWPEGPSAASRAAASLTARNSTATREIASDQLPHGARPVRTSAIHDPGVLPQAS